MSDISKPSDVPTWATNGDKLQPPAEMQAQGFLPRERATAQHFNWLFNSIGKWLQWLENVLSGPVLPISGSADQQPCLELRSNYSHEYGGVHWTSERVEGDDKRIAAISFGRGELDIRLRNRDEGTLNSCMTLSDYRIWLEKEVYIEKPLTVPLIYLQPNRADVDHGGASVVELYEGDTTIDIGNSSWVKVLVSEEHVGITGVRGCLPGQVVICEFQRADPSLDLATVTFRHLEAGPTEWPFFWHQGMSHTMSVKRPNDPHASIICAFLCTEKYLRKI